MSQTKFDLTRYPVGTASNGVPVGGWFRLYPSTRYLALRANNGTWWYYYPNNRRDNRMFRTGNALRGFGAVEIPKAVRGHKKILDYFAVVARIEE